MPSMPASIIRLTALPPPPPTPTTFMRAPVMGGSSSMKMFIPLPGSRSSGVIAFSSLPNLEGFHCLFRLFWAGLSTGTYILRTIYCTDGRPAYNTWSENTTAKSAAKLGNEVRQSSGAAALCACSLLECMSTLRHQRQSRGGRPRWTLHVFDQSSKAIAFGITDPHRRIEDLFCYFNHAIEQTTAAGQHNATRQLPIPT